MNRFLLALAFTAVLAGCGSSVKLDDVAVEDKSGTPVAGQGGAGGQGGAAGAGGSAGGVTNTAIAPVNLGAAAGGAGAAAMAPAEARTVYFDYDSFVIKPAYQAVIESQARYLKADRNRKASIEGHTDERGGREYNLALGQKRSEAVRRALGLLGVPDAQVEAVSFGKEKLAAQGSDEASMAKNRRAEISYR
jgi:peptidoglycan-associated lipoprotein